MTQEEIIKMAREAGVRDDENIFEFSQYKYLEAFAKLVRADYSKLHASLWLKRIDDAVKKEREECAKICENEYIDFDWAHVEQHAAEICAEAIRARGQE